MIKQLKLILINICSERCLVSCKKIYLEIIKFIMNAISSEHGENSETSNISCYKMLTNSDFSILVVCLLFIKLIGTVKFL